MSDLDNEKKYSKKFKVTSYNVNRYSKISLSSIFYQMQEIAWEHAHSLGFGFDHLREDNLFWVLSRIWIRIERRADWQEELSISTKIRGSDGFFAYRDFEIIDSNNNVIVSAISSWLAIDIETKSIARLNKHKHFQQYEKTKMERECKKVKPPKSDGQLSFSPVLFNEIDVNQHFNSGKYIERIINSYSFDFHKKYQLKEIEINFVKEGQPDDYLAVKKEQIANNVHLCSVVRQNDLVELVKTELVWAER